MKVIFIHTLGSEINRVKYTFGKIRFYEEQGYKVFLPTGIKISDSEERLKQKIHKEFDSKEIKNIKKLISEEFNKHNGVIEDYIYRLDPKFPQVIDVVLTQYGVGGSYHLPNRIIINVRYKIDQLFNLIHELTHLAIEENIVNKNTLTHPEKEVLVNWLMNNDEHIKKLFSESYILNKNKFSLSPDKVAKKCGLI